MQVAAGAHTVDMTNNRLSALPPSFSGMTCLQRLHLGANRLTQQGLHPALLPAFQGLHMLCLSHNRLCRWFQIMFSNPDR